MIKLNNLISLLEIRSEQVSLHLSGLDERSPEARRYRRELDRMTGRLMRLRRYRAHLEDAEHPTAAVN